MTTWVHTTTCCHVQAAVCPHTRSTPPTAKTTAAVYSWCIPCAAVPHHTTQKPKKPSLNEPLSRKNRKKKPRETHKTTGNYNRKHWTLSTEVRSDSWDWNLKLRWLENSTVQCTNGFGRFVQWFCAGGGRGLESPAPHNVYSSNPFQPKFFFIHGTPRYHGQLNLLLHYNSLLWFLCRYDGLMVYIYRKFNIYGLMHGITAHRPQSRMFVEGNDFPLLRWREISKEANGEKFAALSFLGKPK